MSLLIGVLFAITPFVLSLLYLVNAVFGSGVFIVWEGSDLVPVTLMGSSSFFFSLLVFIMSTVTFFFIFIAPFPLYKECSNNIITAIVNVNTHADRDA